MLANYVIAHARAAASRVLGTAKAVLVNLESILGSDTSTDAPFFGALGVVARPRAPVVHDDATPLAPEGECEVLCAKYEDELQPIAARDLRINARTNPVEGEVMLAGYDGGFVSIKQASNGQGSQVVILAPALDSGSGAITTSHGLTLDPGTQNAVSLVHRSGHGVLLTSAGNAILKNASGNAYVQAGTGLTLNGNTQVVGGMVVSPGTPTPQPVMLATDQLAWIAQVNTWIGEAQAAFVAIAAAAGNNPNPSITTPAGVPSAAPIGSTKLSAAP